MKKKIIIISIVAIVIIIGISVIIGINISNDSSTKTSSSKKKSSNSGMGLFGMDEMEMPEDMEEWEDPFIFGEGTITSFNIEKLDTTLWKKIDKVLVNNEDVVQANQEILNVSNDEATGKIYSTIGGKIFIEDSSRGRSFTIYDLDNLGFEMLVDEENAKKLKIGQKVECTTYYSINDSIIGRVCYISSIPRDNKIKVRVKLDNIDKVRIGFKVSALIDTEAEIDSSTPVYDIKNSITKIGKTNITYKNTGEQIDFSSIEELSMDEDLFAEYEKALAEQEALIEELSKQIEELMNQENTEVDEEAISEYYNEYWRKYWEEKNNQDPDDGGDDENVDDPNNGNGEENP